MAQPTKDPLNKISEFDEKLIKYLSHHYGLSKEDEYCVLTAFAGLNKSVREMGADMPCFVTLGVSLNMSSHGVVMGFPSVLLPQLNAPGSYIAIDVSSGSWIASIIGIALLIGNVLVPTIMTRYGRRNANLISIVVMTIGWFCIITAPNLPTLILARFLQGLSLGMSASLGSVLIGEYTSPRNRGAFLTTISLSFTFGVLTVHTLGTFHSWQRTALVCAIVTFMNLPIVTFSPESPSWLIDQRRYSEGERVFRWLRGNDEEEELKKIISSKMSETKVDEYKTLKRKVKDKISYLNLTLRKKEFYKPIIVMIHLYALSLWSGSSILAAYTTDIYQNIIGNGVNIGLVIISVDSQRIVSNIIAIFVIKKIKRRSVLIATVSLNILVLLTTAGFTYAKSKGVITSDYPVIGILLIHTHMFSFASGIIPLPFIIAGELFPLEYRGLAGAISALFLSINIFATIKVFPFLFTSIGLYGTYCVHAAVTFYCVVVVLLLLPETKDRILKDIEDEFRGFKSLPEEMELTNVKREERDK